MSITLVITAVLVFASCHSHNAQRIPDYIVVEWVNLPPEGYKNPGRLIKPGPQIIVPSQPRLDCSDLPARVSGAGPGGLWTVTYPRRECELENKRRGY